MNSQNGTSLVLGGLVVVFLGLTVAFVLNLWGHTAPLPPIPLVEPWVTNTATVRTNLAKLIRLKADLSDFDCYGCHEKKKPPQLRFDAHHNIVVPEAHNDIVMGHGRHGRNNNCYNCHDESNLEVLQTRDGRELKLVESPALCGSCHGPTYRDWEAGAHGRTSGNWNHASPDFHRQDCTACHNPHSPRFPGRTPAPGPHPLRPRTRPALAAEESR